MKIDLSKFKKEPSKTQSEKEYDIRNINVQINIIDEMIAKEQDIFMYENSDTDLAKCSLNNIKALSAMKVQLIREKEAILQRKNEEKNKLDPTVMGALITGAFSLASVVVITNKEKFEAVNSKAFGFIKGCR